MLMMATLGKVSYGSIKPRKEPIGLNAEIVSQCLRKQWSSRKCHPISEMAYKVKMKKERLTQTSDTKAKRNKH